jgi:hypothetical protein
MQRHRHHLACDESLNERNEMKRYSDDGNGKRRPRKNLSPSHQRDERIEQADAVKADRNSQPE